VCMQCHLEPTSGNLPSIIRKFDRDPFSFVAGQPLEDFAQYFDYRAGTKYDDRFQIVSAAYRLRKSRCFLESQGNMTCLNCHDPHKDLPTGEAAVKFYAAACSKCHSGALREKVAAGKHPASENCISCHMPKRRTEDVVHAVITDHYIQRRLPNRDLLADLIEQHGPDSDDYHGEVIPYYPAQPAPTNENRLYRSVAQVLLQNNLESGAAALNQEISKNPATRPEFYTTLGDAWMNLKEPAKAGVVYEQGAKLPGSQSMSALQGLARAQQQTGDAAKSEETLKRILRLAPLEPNTWYQYSLLDAEQGRREEALVKLKKALSLDPDLAEGYFNLANLSIQTGRAQEAEPALMTALSIDPYDAASYDLLGQVMAMKRDLPASLYNFGKATQLRPTYAPYLYDDALALIQAGRYDEAKTQVLAAIHANSEYAEAHEILGALYVREKQTAEAVKEYQKALAIRPDMNRVHLNLGLLLYSQGDKSGAITHLRQAASDSNAAVAGPAAQALEKIGAR
jgi:tetratricopeptide (TPR) repeat protein